MFLEGHRTAAGHISAGGHILGRRSRWLRMPPARSTCCGMQARRVRLRSAFISRPQQLLAQAWSPRLDVSAAGLNVEHCFPALAAGAAGDVRIAWMDTRAGSAWNTYYRSRQWWRRVGLAESRLSGFVRGFDYIKPEGFRFPFGDYFEMDIDRNGDTHAVWGEGLNFRSPGSIWYSRGR